MIIINPWASGEIESSVEYHKTVCASCVELFANHSFLLRRGWSWPFSLEATMSVVWASVWGFCLRLVFLYVVRTLAC